MTENNVDSRFDEAEEQLTPSRRSKNGKEKKEKSVIREFLEMAVIAAVLAILIKTFIAGNYYVPSGSMEPTIITNDKVIVTNFSYYLNEPERGDVIVFEYPEDRTKDYIKRCIGLPGETVEFKDSKLYVNGEQIHLTPIEYKLLDLLSHNVGKVLTYQFITKNVWGSSYDSDIASLRVFMAGLRKKLHGESSIQTHIGIGYCMVRAE